MGSVRNLLKAIEISRPLLWLNTSMPVLWGFAATRGSIDGEGLLLFVLFVQQLGTEQAIERARTQAIVILGLWSAAVAARLSRLGTRASQLVVGFSLGGLALVVAIPGLRSALHLAPLPASGWGMAVAAVFVSILPWWRE